MLEKRLADIAKELEAAFFKKKKTFEVYRGDSFQALLENPADALKIALLWRAGVRATPDKHMWDIRIAIGIGAAAHRAATLAASGGPAFHVSGTLLDSLKAQSDSARIAIQTPDDDWNAALRTECLLAEASMGSWSRPVAEAVFQQLLRDETQAAIAKRLNISQPAVHKRLQNGVWPAIRHWEAYFRETAARKLAQTADI